MTIEDPNVLGAGRDHVSTGPGLGLARGLHRARVARWRRGDVARARLAPALAPTRAAPTTLAADLDHGLAQGSVVSCVAGTGEVAVGMSVARTTVPASTRTTAGAADGAAAAVAVETSAATMDVGSNKNGATTALEEDDPSGHAEAVVAVADPLGVVVSVTLEIAGAVVIQDHAVLKDHADPDLTAQKDETKIGTATPVTRNAIAIVARVNMKKKGTWTEKNTTESGLMETSPRETPTRRRSNPPNKPPKNKITRVWFCHRVLVLRLCSKYCLGAHHLTYVLDCELTDLITNLNLTLNLFSGMIVNLIREQVQLILFHLTICSNLIFRFLYSHTSVIHGRFLLQNVF